MVWNFRSAAILLTVAMIAPASTLWAADAPLDDIQQLSLALKGSTSTLIQQQEAAKRLLERTSPQAKSVLLEALSNPGSPNTQIAVAKALAGEANPDPVYIQSLTLLIGSSPAITKEAARALANYPSDPNIVNSLKIAAGNLKTSEVSRAQIVRAMGLLNDKDSAAFLIDLLNSKSELLRNAASDALSDMTGLHETGQDWLPWWTTNSTKSPDQFRNDLLVSRAREFNQTKQRYADMSDELQALLVEQYGMIANPKAKKSDAILRYLQSRVPEVRVNGIKLVYDDFTLGHPISDEARQQLRSMIGDSDRNVRLQVAQKLKAFNDVGASPALIAQLGQEPDQQVRLSIIQALDESADIAAVPVLVKLLSGTVDDATAAATALSKEMGEKLRKDKDRLDEVKSAVDALRKTFDTRTGNDPSTDGLRAACVAALATLCDPGSLQLFRDRLKPNESPDVRKAALRGLGYLEDRQSIPLMADSLSDPKPEVRLEAALALRDLATFAQAAQLYTMVNPTDEPDARVRDAAWADLKSVLRNGTPAELNDWQDRFKDDPEKHLEVLQALHGALQKENDKKQLAINSQTIADILLTLKRAPEAIDNFQTALDYWQNEGKNEPTVETKLDALVGGMLDAQLMAHRYTDAADFSAKQIASNPRYHTIVDPKIKNEADRLRMTGDKDSALQLIDAALKMPKEHALDQRYQNNLLEIQKQINQPGPAGP